MSLDNSDSAENSNFLGFPIIVLVDSKSIQVKRHVTTSIKGTKINYFHHIGTFPTLVALLEALLVNNSENFCIDNIYRQQVANAINDLYISSPLNGANLSLQQRFVLEQGLLRKLRYSSASKFSFGPMVFSQINKHVKEQKNSDGIHHKVPISDIESAMMVLSKMYEEKQSIAPITIAPSESYRFLDDNQLIVWLLHYLIDHGIEIKRCHECGKLFIVTSGRKEYCSKDCYNTYRDLGRYCNEKEFEKVYNNISSLFRTRLNENPETKGFKYVKPKVPYQTEAYDELSIFAGLDGKNPKEDDDGLLYTYEDMTKIKRKVQELRLVEWKNCRDAYRRQRRGEITELELNVAKVTYINWVNDVCLQLKAFKRIRNTPIRRTRRQE